MALQTSRLNPMLAQQQQAIKDKAQTDYQQGVSSGGDIGSILGLIGAGLGAALAIGTGGIAAAPIMAIGSIAGAAGLGGQVGKVVGSEVAKNVVEAPKPMINQGQEELSAMSAMQRRLGQSATQMQPQAPRMAMPELSPQTQTMIQSVNALGQLPEDYQNEYGDLLLKGLTKSFGKDILRSRGGKV